MAVFNFCPNSLVPVMLPRDPTSAVTMNGWVFSAKPTTPYIKTYKITLHGLRWFLNSDGTFNSTLSPTINAKALELFYEEHETWKPFDWTHPHLGISKQYRFLEKVSVPAGISNSDGLIEPLDIKIIEHNPGYT